MTASRAEPRPRRGPRVWFLLGPVLLVMVIGTVTAGFVRAPYVAYAPGSARSTEPLVEVPRGEGYRTPGEVLFTTVSVVTRPSYLQALWGWVDGDIDVFPSKAIYGDQSADESRRYNLALMDTSKLVAAKVAFEKLGYEVATRGSGVLIVAVEPDLPVSGVLRPGDVVTRIDAKPVRLDTDLIAAIRGHRPGDEVHLVLERAGVKRPVEVDVALSPRPEDREQPMLGVQVQTRDLRFDLPFDVTIDSGSVGGPSAGLAFTLALLDRLTPGSLTGGHRVAVTGEIGPSGQVIQVGGVAQKAVAAREAGAELFLVPASEAAEARAHAGAMEVARVGTLDDALKALSRLGGNALALGRPGADRPGA